MKLDNPRSLHTGDCHVNCKNEPMFTTWYTPAAALRAHYKQVCHRQRQRVPGAGPVHKRGIVQAQVGRARPHVRICVPGVH